MMPKSMGTGFRIRIMPKTATAGRVPAVDLNSLVVCSPTYCLAAAFGSGTGLSASVRR